MTRVGLIDCSWPAQAGRVPPHPSPTLLRAGRACADAGDEVTYLGTMFDRASCDRFILLSPPWAGPIVRERAAALGDAPVELLDPWAAQPAAALPGYALAGYECHGEVDVPPSPVHPWVVAAAPGLVDPTPAAAEARLRAAFAGLAGLRHTAMVLGDERIAFSTERLRSLAEMVSGSLRDRKSMVSLHVRAWPGDMMAERMLDHLSLLPMSAFDLMLGTLNEAALERMGSSVRLGDIVGVLGGLETSGLAAMTTLSICAGLPGETIDQSVAVLDSTLRLAAKHGIARVRVSMWLGEHAAPPRDPVDQKERFLASHPTWSETEYRGFHDLVVVIRQVAPNIDLVGPGFLPEWDDVP
ncbi:MAG: hypothetical protein KIT31_40210 [Deltaproteobacteria bacterium]|nr:hypothetical protein [Deltaproteobacteria bacterium]